MKVTSLFFTIIVLLIYGCSKDDNCIDNVIGIYSGNCTSTLGTFSGNFNISKSSSGGSNILIQETTLVYNATVSSDCKTISIPSQGLVLTNGTAGTINGTLQLNGTSLTGSITIVVGSVGTVCNYNFTRK